MTRLALWALRLRDWLVWVLPIAAIAAIVALLLTLVNVNVTVAGERDDQAETLRQVEALAAEAKDASETNRQILEQLKPCAPNKPQSPACVQEAERNQRIADAINAIASQHDEVLRRLENLLARPAAQRGAPAPPTDPVTRTAPRTTARPSPAPATTTATTAMAAPVTTVCPERGKRPKECR